MVKVITGLILTGLPFVGAVAYASGTYTAANAEELYAILRDHNGEGATVQLTGTDYHLTELMEKDSSDNAGKSHLYLHNTTLLGMGERMDDVRLIGGASARVVQLSSSGVLRNLTVTNGNAVAQSGRSNANRGGGVYGGGKVYGCLLIGNKAAGVGGAAHSSTKLYDCRIVNNEGSNGGGLHNCTAYRCEIEQNAATGDGGGVYNSSLYDCLVSGNSAGTSNGGGGGYDVQIASNCVFVANTAYKGGAVLIKSGAGVSANVLMDCVVSNNVAKASGGGVYGVTVIGGEVVGNSVNNGNGGGAYQAVVSNCIVRANVCSNQSAVAYGGGVYESTVFGGEICGNCSRTYQGGKAGGCGGAYNSQIANCIIHDNLSDGDAGGVRKSTLKKCTLLNNVASGDGMNAYESNLDECMVVGTGIYSGSANMTTFRDIGGDIAPKDNPYGADAVSVKRLWNGYINATNCQFVGNTLYTGECTLFNGVQKADTTSSLINCTIVSNRFYATFANYQKTEFPMTVWNCVFYGNYRVNGNDGDITLYSASSSSKCEIGAVGFDRCAYGVANVPQGLENFVVQGGEIYQFGINGFGSRPKFCLERDPNNPYALRRGSPLIGKGRKMDWMEGATDIRGGDFARLRDGAVDIGCYQCWLPAPGLAILFR